MTTPNHEKSSGAHNFPTLKGEPVRVLTTRNDPQTNKPETVVGILSGIMVHADANDEEKKAAFIELSGFLIKNNYTPDEVKEILLSMKK